MPLESGTYISDFVAANPAHSDNVQQGDSHLRWIKSAILATFTGITGAVTATHTQINSAVGAVVTGTQQALHFAGTLGSPGVSFVGNTACGLYASGTNAIALVTNGVAALTITAAQAVAMAGAVTVGSLTSTGAYSGGTGQLGIIGEPRLWLADTLPTGNFGWLNGQAISRSGNPVLFALWGTKYGSGDGSTTFNVPNFQDVVPVGKDGMGGATSPALIAASGPNANIGVTGDIVGEGAHTLAQSELPNVAPTFTGTLQTWNLNNQSRRIDDTTPVTASGSGSFAESTNTFQQQNVTVTPHGTISSINGGVTQTAANNVQPAIVCNWITLLG